MGGAGASRPIIDYEEAVERLGWPHVSKIREGFARLAVREGRLGRHEFRTGFLNSIAGVPVPEELATALFNAFDSKASGHITEEQFICGLAILCRGDSVERLRLLFAVYDADRDKRLSDRDLLRFAHALDDGQHSATRETALRDAMSALRAKGPSVGFDHFEQWAKKNMNSPLIQWVNFYSDHHSAAAPLTSAQESMRPFERSKSMEVREANEELSSLCVQLGVPGEFGEDMRDQWVKLVERSKLGVVDAEVFGRTFSSLHESLVRRLFKAMDETKSFTLSLKEWTAGVHVCLNGSDEQRVAFCFGLFADAPAAAAAVSRTSQTVMPVEEVRHFCRFLDGCLTSFAATSPCRKRSLEEEPELPEGGLQLQHFSQEPWASRASGLVRSIGRLIRVDLGLLPEDRREEREIVDWLSPEFDVQAPGRPGNVWYLLSARWWDQWRGTREGLQINNYDLLVPSSLSRVRIGLSFAEDYKVVTEGAWRALHAWYGGPGPALPRRVVDIDGQCELEIYPLCLHIFRTDTEGKELLADEVMVVSRTMLLREVKEQACGKHKFPVPAAISHKRTASDEDAWVLGDESKTLHELGFIDEHRLLLRRLDQVVPPAPSGGKLRLGSVGLANLGNTCYMNASLQCLLNTPLLTTYFEDQYAYDLNVHGGWGMSGKLAVAFSELWADVKRQRLGSGAVAPRAFRRTVGDFKVQFGGYRQQDAQEFLSIFLAGLSDDVNRTAEKPYIELKDSEGRLDQVVANEFWAAHCRREQSAVAALFSSQFKSVMRCKTCGHNNSTFDPFSFLPIPLPEHNFRWVTCHLVRAPTDGSFDQHTVEVCVRVPKRGKLSDLLKGVAGLTGLAPEELAAAEVSSGVVHRRLAGDLLLSSLSDDARPVVFHLPTPRQPAGQHPEATQALQDATDQRQEFLAESSDGEERVTVFLVHRRLQKVERYFLNPYAPELFGTPLMLRLPATCTGSELYARVFAAVQHVVPDLPPPAPGARRPEAAYPFGLSFVKRDGSACATCSWRKGCLGCPATDRSSSPARLREEATLGIDWDARVLDKHYKVRLAGHVHVHESVRLGQMERDTPESLAQCLEGLVRQEEIVAYCKGCTKERGEFTETSHSKGFKVWACGPLLVLQLKRFHSGDGASYKLHNLITFPVDIDMSPYLAGDAEVAVPAAAGVGECANGEATAKPPEQEHSVFKTLSRTVTNYQLYGVVNHIGGMGYGHYTAFVRHEGPAGGAKRWFCCDDDRVYPVSEEDVVSPNAYLLFYARADVAAGQVGLPDLYPPLASGQAVRPEEVKRRPWMAPPKSSPCAAPFSQDSGFCGVM